ncbi:MAG: PAS domain S-box protein [Bacteroidia bacterium]|nr:PAS domain S-box protein [Bacteroidia bacterium]
MLYNAQQIQGFLQSVAQTLAAHDARYLNLKERLNSLSQEIKDRTVIIDRFALVSETDTRGVITYANSRFCEVSGYSLDELLGKPHNIVRHPDMPKETFRELWDTIKSGKIWQGIIKNRRKDGSHYWVLATVGPLLDAEGYPYRYVSMRVDITQQKNLEEQLRSERNLLAGHLMENLLLVRSVQESLLLGNQTEVLAHIPHFFVWKPLQVLSGDFFWGHRNKDKLLLVVGDSIGHGTSAGFLSLIFLQELQYAVLDRGIYLPEQLMEILNSRLDALFRLERKFPVSVDGAILLIDLANYQLDYIAMRSRIALARNGEVLFLERYPYSFGEVENQLLFHHTLKLQKGDRLYFQTDGIMDLTIEGKKIGTKGYQSLLRDIQGMSLPEQKSHIQSLLEGKHGSALQRDDMLVLCLEIL